MRLAERLDAVRCRVDCGRNVEALLFANEAVEIDRASLADLATFAELADTLSRLDDLRMFGDEPARLGRIVLTPDFHRGSALPVGTVAELHGIVLPQAIGNDIGCGMSLAVLDVPAEDVTALGPALDTALRHVFFEGGRDIRLDSAQRAAVLAEGVAGIAAGDITGLLARLDSRAIAEAAQRMHGGGRIEGAEAGESFLEWIAPGGRTRPTRDSFVGTIGGGNHFVEFQAIDKIVDRHSGWAWDLREGDTAVMVHSGSLNLGRAVALRHLATAAELWPSRLPRPDNGFLPLPLIGAHAAAGRLYLAEMAAAANFAMLNRLALSLMAAEALERVLGRRVGWRLVHDLPHNLVRADGASALHRKGACPAGHDPLDPVFPNGHPVIVPGSMGTESWLLRGLGAPESLASAPHGAGRTLKRNAGRKLALSPALRIVTRIDFSRTRGDVAREVGRSLAEEAPAAYKNVQAVIDTVEDAGLASRVARLTPILTIKG